MAEERVLKYGTGYHVVVVEERSRRVAGESRLVLGIRCLRCTRLSFHPTDVAERYCGACHVFHEDGLFAQQA